MYSGNLYFSSKYTVYTLLLGEQFYSILLAELPFLPWNIQASTYNDFSNALDIDFKSDQPTKFTFKLLNNTFKKSKFDDIILKSSY